MMMNKKISNSIRYLNLIVHIYDILTAYHQIKKDKKDDGRGERYRSSTQTPAARACDAQHIHTGTSTLTVDQPAIRGEK